MNQPGWRSALVAVALLLLCGRTFGFEQAFESPAFVVSVPGVPPMALARQHLSGDAKGFIARGQDGTYTIDVTAAASPQAVSSRVCAGAFMQELVKRPNMPDRDSIYRAAFDANTFLVLYLIERRDQKLLHAHLLSAVAGSHCIDAHFSRPLKAGEEPDNWRTTFAGARVREGKR